MVAEWERNSRSVQAPAWPWRPPLALEQRAGLELGQLLSSPVYYGAGVPFGDRRPVLLVPGFLGSDSYLQLLSGWLRRVGYLPARSGIAFNAGSLTGLLGQVERRAEALALAGRRITIIGHSLGGVFARVVGVTRPDLVERVITLGSPLSGNPRQMSHPLVRTLGEILIRREGEGEAEAMRKLGAPLPASVSLISIYTCQDAVVYWRACIDSDPHSLNLEVGGSHIGLAWNASVYRRLGRLLPG